MNITTILALLGSALLIRQLLNKKIEVVGSYKVGSNIPNRLDALHSFESRKSDGFGGKMTSKINKELNAMFQRGINPDIESITIDIDPIKYEVKWKAVLIPSKDGKAYRGVITRGSAGEGADERAINQIPKLKTAIPKSFNHQLVLDYNLKQPKIRQFFYKYQIKDGNN